MPDFCHLHCHTQFSLLDGASDIPGMMKKAKADGQKAVALTDHGNMFGAFKFVAEAKKHGIKAIIGCEFYLVQDRFIKSFSRAKGEYDRRYHQLLLAKNRTGYQNLIKLCSLGFKEGLYNKFPRIDKTLIEKYHEGIIATSCCIGAEVPQLIVQGRLEEAEKALKWWHNIFGEDYYIELQRHHGLENLDMRNEQGQKVYSNKSQEDVNQVLLGFAKKYNIKTIATNDVHYLEEEDSSPHDILLCVNTGRNLHETDRFKFPSSDFFFKTKEEMNTIFGDVPQAIDNTMEIASKVESLELVRDVILPEFPLPSGFDTQELFLRHLAFTGAKQRYGTITPQIEERINFELQVINNSGYPGYFLIVQDFTTAARDMDVIVGPGRGSAAGSAVAYCLGITNIDPIKYDLLFERFLNPERVSMPDIDIDFDDEGRSKVIDYVIDKYGKNQVAQIITYGTMAAKSALRDVGRVMDIPLHEVNRVVGGFPKQLGATLKDVLADEDINKKLKDNLNGEEKDKAYQFRELAIGQSDIAKMIQEAKKLEGSIRNTGIHACGVIITPDDITEYIPVSVSKDADLLVSQFDNSVVEDAGLLKMDFLGLRTLSIIKDAVKMIAAGHDVHIEIDEISLEDEKTYELFQRGETVAVFQYESPGMQKHLKSLEPSTFYDIIAMNALYRPGPMEYIDDFIARKHGRQEISYDLDAMEEILKETYGITVYQEQVMLLSQKLANFTKGEADVLRKAMGKKKKKLIDELFPKFEEGCAKNGHDLEKVKKIWKDWEKFASYAFNKSHSTCYAFIAFQTAYLKAHYPAEFMASVLNHNKNDISKVTFFLDECRRMKLDVLPPNVSESFHDFRVNAEGQIRFGLSALKGVGAAPVEELVRARNEGAEFNSIFDLARKLNLRVMNKRCFESLAYAGAFDEFGETRAQYFSPSDKYDTLIEHAVKYGNAYQAQKESSKNSLFGDLSEQLLDEPKIQKVDGWSSVQKLEYEKQVTGMYISGHPLDDYKFEIKHFINCPLSKAEDKLGERIKLAGIVTEAHHGVSKSRGTGYVRFKIQDYHGSFEAGLYRENYMKWKDLIFTGQVIYIEGMHSKYRDQERYFFKIFDIKLLETLGRDLTKSITIQIPLQKITDEFLARMKSLCEENQGKIKVKVNVSDPEAEYNIDFLSSGVHIDLSRQLINAFDEMELGYILN